MNLHRFRKLSYACSQEALIAVTGARNAGSRFTALADWNTETVDVPTAGNTDAPEPKNTGRNQGGTVTYKARIFTREEFREVIAAAIYDYEHAPAKCLYTTKDAADQLYGEYGEETEVEE